MTADYNGNGYYGAPPCPACGFCPCCGRRYGMPYQPYFNPHTPVFPYYAPPMPYEVTGPPNGGYTYWVT